MKKVICVLLCLLLATSVRPAYSWSEGGHHIIAVMAFKMLNKEEQEKLLLVLSKHPKYADDFSPPADLPNESEKTYWRVGRAGYWPDVARKNPTYDRPNWHFELGAALVVGDKANLNVPERPGVLPQDVTLDTLDLHISQAIVLCKKILSDKTRPEADRAIAFCWIAHLVGDSHQPCHAGSLYMEKVFMEADGDRGANRILIVQGRNMHSLWDQLLGDEFTLNGTRKRIAEITADEHLVAVGKQAIAAKEGFDPQVWLAESRAAAVEHVYAPEVLDSLKLVTRGLIENPEKINLSEAYLKNAGRVAQTRAIEAAYRLAETWRKALE